MPGVGPFGTYDMSGNVREWSLEFGLWRSALAYWAGRGRRRHTSLFDPEALPPFDRSPLNGFRCVRNRVALPREVAAPIVPTGARICRKRNPYRDELFQAYRAEYAYDKSPLRAVSGWDH